MLEPAALGGHLEWALDWGWSARVVVFALAAAILILAWSNLRRLHSLPKRLVLLGLRGCLVLGLIAVFLQPTWVERRDMERTRVVAVLIDASGSMAHENRLARAKIAAKRLGIQGSIRIFALQPKLQQVMSAHTIEARGHTTDLIAALGELRETVDQAALAAVVIISDGIDPQLANGLPTRAKESVIALGVPVHVIALPDVNPKPDIAIAAVRMSPFAFVRNHLPVEVDLVLDGLAERSGNITLVASLDGVPVSSKTVPLMGPRRRTLTLSLQPKTLGGHVLTVAATPLPDELTQVNNQAHRALRVIRDRVRVLHLAGHPSWDSRFLRRHLRADPAVDLISFYIMVGRGGAAFVQGAETSLIPFPSEQLFGPALDDFDLIIFSDFQFAPFGIERYLPRVQRWVEAGGAFVVFGGQEALTSGGYGRSSIARWLPVRLDAPAGGQSSWHRGVFAPQRTTLGKHHAITRLGVTAAANERLWSRLRLEGFNSRSTARLGGAVLLQGPSGRPLLTIAERGAGRIAVWGTDSLWTWAYPDETITARQEVREAYHQHLGRLRGWLLRDPAYRSILLHAERSELLPGEHTAIAVSLLGPDQRPARNVDVQWRVVPLPISDRPDGDTKASRHPWQVARSDDDGKAHIRWRAGQSGPWRLQLQATIEGRVQRESMAIAVAQASVENLNLRATPERLRPLARWSGGRFWPEKSSFKPIPMAKDAAPTVHEYTHRQVWQSPWVALILLLLLIAEWSLRRRWQLA